MNLIKKKGDMSGVHGVVHSDSVTTSHELDQVAEESKEKGEVK